MRKGFADTTFMPRKRFQFTTEFKYHVSARCLNKDWFEMPLSEVWEICSEYLYFCNHAFGLQISSFVLMNNHFHMLVQTPDAPLSEIINYFMREVSKAISRQTGRINQTFGGPYYWSILKTNIYQLHAYKYVYRNPVHAGLIEKVEDYKFSTLGSLLGREPLIIPVTEDKILFPNPEKTLNWLNTEYGQKDFEAIKFAIRRKEFRFGTNKDRAPNPLEAQVI